MTVLRISRDRIQIRFHLLFPKTRRFIGWQERLVTVARKQLRPSTVKIHRRIEEKNLLKVRILDLMAEKLGKWKQSNNRSIQPRIIVPLMKGPFLSRQQVIVRDRSLESVLWKFYKLKLNATALNNASEYPLSTSHNELSFSPRVPARWNSKN